MLIQKNYIIKKFGEKMLRNTNYCENTKYHMDIINCEVDKMMAEKINPHPHNFVSITNGITFPKLNHEALEIPGKFKQRESIYGFTNDGTLIFMDQVTSVCLDNEKKKRELGVNYEYLVGKLKPEKKERLLDYDVSIQVILKKPAFEVVISDYDYGIDEECMKIDGSAIRVLYRTFDKKAIYKTLNKLNNIDYHKQEMSGHDFIKWAQCIAFARQPYAQDYIEKCVDLFTRIEKINYDYQMNLHMSLKVMIKSQFKDEKTVRRLLTMITKAIPYNKAEDICAQESYHKEYMRSMRVIKTKLAEYEAIIAENEAVIAKNEHEILELRKRIEELENENKNK